MEELMDGWSPWVLFIARLLRPLDQFPRHEAIRGASSDDSRWHRPSKMSTAYAPDKTDPVITAVIHPVSHTRPPKHRQVGWRWMTGQQGLFPLQMAATTFQSALLFDTRQRLASPPGTLPGHWEARF